MFFKSAVWRWWNSRLSKLIRSLSLLVLILISDNVESLSDQFSNPPNPNYLVRRYLSKEPLLFAYAPVHIDIISSATDTTPSQLWGYSGSWKEIICAVKSNPPARFTWTLQGRPITHSDYIKFSTPQKNVSILKVRIKDFLLGEYKCRSENELGAVEMKVTVGKSAKPPVPNFMTIVDPGLGIWIKVIEVKNEGRRNLDPIFGEGLNKEIPTGQLLPTTGFILQTRIFRSCDNWTNILIPEETVFLSAEEKGFKTGVKYRMRLAATTEAGTGEFSQAQTVLFVKNMESE